MNVYLQLLIISIGYSSFIWAEKTPIVIGLNADMSAVAIEGGEAIRRGAQIAIDEINAEGGLFERPLKLMVRDHRGNPARGLANIKKFSTQNNLLAVLGGVHTPVVLYELEEVHKQQLLYLIPWAAGNPIIDNGFDPNYIFRLSVRDEHAGHVLMAEAKKRAYKRVGLLLERTGWGRSNDKSMNIAAKSFDMKVVATEWFNWRESNMKDQLDRIHKAGAEVIILVANVPEGAAIIKTISELANDEKLPVLSHWGISSGSFVEKTGIANILKMDLSILQTYSFLNDRKSKVKNRVLSAYRKSFDTNVTPESIPAAPGIAHAYDLIYLLVMAAKTAKSLDSVDVRQALENINEYEGLLKTYKKPFGPNKHDALIRDDYIISRYTEKGYLVPIVN